LETAHSLPKVAPTASMDLLFIRHGETESNAEKRYMGQLDSPLSALGMAQAAAVAARLAKTGIGTLYSSDLGRAATTANAIAEACQLELQLDRRLRERHAGIFQGLRHADAKERFPEAYQAIQTPEADTAIPEGESAAQIHARLAPLITEVCQQHPGETVALVTHGMVIRAVLWQFLGASYSLARWARVDNTSLARFRFEHGRWILLAWNDTGHMQSQ
jgi:2,3-bisphosphoglycerate-dependent phosphoglycerate mutase